MRHPYDITEPGGAANPAACLTYTEALDLVTNRLSAEKRAAAEAHVDDCDACRRWVSELAQPSELSTSTKDDSATAFGRVPFASRDGNAQPGVDGESERTIGRYVLLEPLGAGAMGLVFAAYDPRLKRKVALKLVPVAQHDNADRSERTLEERLVREAQAMARLSHPNVTSVYDAGSDGKHVYIAMEIVEGTTLTEWLAQRPFRGWRKVLEAFVAAGRGLAAAHAADVIHRDFKPDNVLVGRDGRVSVSDFGLARAEDDDPTVMSNVADSTSADARITQVGTQLGTPAYMAPEQRDDARAADARSDQYSFCASLFEALWGTRPGGLPARSRARGRVPRRLRQIVERGLRLEPELRYPSMTALLAAIARGERARRRRGIVAVIALCAMAASFAVLPRLSASEPNESGCGGAAARLSRIWDSRRKLAVQAAVLAHRTTYAPTMSRAIEHALDDYADHWVAMHTETCEDSAVRHTPSDSVLAVRMACLEQRRQELEQAVALLADSTTPPEHALQVATSLSSVAGCADLPALGEVVSAPNDLPTSLRVDSVRRRLASAKVQCDAALYAACDSAARGLIADARAIGYAPLLAQVYYTIGRAAAESSSNHTEQAEHALDDAFLAAEAGRDDSLVVAATVVEAEVIGTTQARYNEAIRLLDRARGSAVRLATISPRSAFDAEGLVLAGRTYLALEHEDFVEAARLGEDALRHAETSHGRDARETAGAHADLGAALMKLGRLDEAMAHHERARQIYATLEGPGHPDLLAVEPNIAIELEQLGRHDDAADMLQHVLSAAEVTYGSADDRLRPILDDLGTARLAQGRAREALTLVDRALAIYEKSPGLSLGEHIAELTNRGIVLGRLERVEEADAAFAMAIAEVERGFGPTSQLLVAPLQSRALASFDAGHPRIAIALFERALPIADRGDGPPLDAVRVRMGLATALASVGERDRAVTLARAARARVTNVAGGATLLAPIDAFLAEQTRPSR
jgi:serine/threonine protein kinase/tetratricopeptide (TPR) repeat protein